MHSLLGTGAYGSRIQPPWVLWKTFERLLLSNAFWMEMCSLHSIEVDVLEAVQRGILRSIQYLSARIANVAV